MTKEQIENGNRLCTEFRGVKPLRGSDGKYFWTGPAGDSAHRETYEQAMDDFLAGAKYDSDWNWLMGVVEKIAEIISKSDGVLYMENYIELETLLPFADIELAFNACVRFINSYNDNSSK